MVGLEWLTISQLFTYGEDGEVHISQLFTLMVISHVTAGRAHISQLFTYGGDAISQLAGLTYYNYSHMMGVVRFTYHSLWGSCITAIHIWWGC